MALKFFADQCVPTSVIHGLQENGHRRTAAFKALRKLRFEEIADSIPWRDAFPELEGPDVTGVCLRGARKKEGLAQEELVKKTGIPQRHISEMENQKRPIGKNNAVLLAKALDVSYRIFL